MQGESILFKERMVCVVTDTDPFLRGCRRLMEKLLLKMAEQLDGLDEASLMYLWNKYAQRVYQFEPTQEWERAALVFCLIQAKHMKNQLFNYHWSLQVRMEQERRGSMYDSRKPAWQKHAEPERKAPCPVLPFEPLADEERDK